MTHKISDDQTQERNRKEREDRIRVSPSVALHLDECKHEGNITQHMVQHHIVMSDLKSEYDELWV